MTMVITDSAAFSALSIPQLGFSCQSSLSWSSSLSRRSGIVSRERSSIRMALEGSSGSVVPVVLRSRRTSGSFLCSRLPSVTRRGIVVGSVPISWIAAGLVGMAGTGALAMVAMAAGQGDRPQALLATRKGMQLFSQGDVNGSLEKFNEALELDPSSLPYLWQRGLSLYYTDQFEEGAKQFRDDVAVNPNDTEEASSDAIASSEFDGYRLSLLVKEGTTLRVVSKFRREVADVCFVRSKGFVGPTFSYLGGDHYITGIKAIWCFLCEAQYLGVEEARRRFLVVGPDRRPIMKEIYNLFRYGGSTDQLLQVMGAPEGADYFYANLYAGLYHEAHKREDAAKEAMLNAVDSFYGTRSGDYMAILARVHAKCRGWKVSLAPEAKLSLE